MGKYYFVDKEEKKTSIIELKNDGKFIYSFSSNDWCNGEVEGTYQVTKDKIKFKNDYEYTKESQDKFLDSLITNYKDTVSVDIALPPIVDMSETEWKIEGKSITPLSNINCGCFTHKSKHIKKQ